MDRDHVIGARFRAREYLETFESGGFAGLPWRTPAGNGWKVTSETGSGGRHSARSGAVEDGGASILELEYETPGGGASFDFRTASETGWDFLEFLINDVLVDRWSGVHGWQTFQFNVTAGRNRYAWRFVRDRTFGGAEDAVWIDNLDLPEDSIPAQPPRLAWVGASAAGCQVRIEGEPGRTYVLELSRDLRVWTPVDQGLSVDGGLNLTDPTCGGDSGGRTAFYRVRAD
jgi:hypothetical protein